MHAWRLHSFPLSPARRDLPGCGRDVSLVTQDFGTCLLHKSARLDLTARCCRAVPGLTDDKDVLGKETLKEVEDSRVGSLSSCEKSFASPAVSADSPTTEAAVPGELLQPSKPASFFVWPFADCVLQGFL